MFSEKHKSLVQHLPVEWRYIGIQRIIDVADIAKLLVKFSCIQLLKLTNGNGIHADELHILHYKVRCAFGNDHLQVNQWSKRFTKSDACHPKSPAHCRRKFPTKH